MNLVAVRSNPVALSSTKKKKNPIYGENGLKTKNLADQTLLKKLTGEIP